MCGEQWLSFLPTTHVTMRIGQYGDPFPASPVHTPVSLTSD
jgi:hypothetical protein